VDQQPKPQSFDLILYRLDELDRKLEERDTRLEAALSEKSRKHEKLEGRVRSLESFRDQQKGQGRIVWAMLPATIVMMLKTLWDLFVGNK
jgi:predicted RNase H-like nuclease (RuvC/YqgF family)